MKGVKVDCKVCKVAASKYKCPKCQVLYCGLGCFKSHNCEDFKVNKDEEKKDVAVDSTQANTNKEPFIHKSNFVEDEELRVPRAKLESLKKSKKLREILQSSKLRATLTRIDDAKSRLWELNNEMKTNPYFLEFTSLLLNEMGQLSQHNEFI